MAYTMSRRRFVKIGVAAGGALAFGGVAEGCAGWTPRSEQNAASAGSAFSNTAELENEEGQEQEVQDSLVLISGGSFTMGSPESEPWRGADEVQHTVVLGDFYLAPCETTQAQYAALMDANPSELQGDDLPVTNVTWYDAAAYCNALSQQQGLAPAYSFEDDGAVVWDRSANGYRLPTEAEWEFACRAGTTTPFNTQTSINADAEANYYGTYPYEIEDNYFSLGNLATEPGVYRHAPVAPATFAPNAWGLYDMHGNVAEWVWDLYGAYDVQSQANPTGCATGSMRVNRGGGWNDFAKNLRSAYRAALPASNSSASLGFRIARNAQPGVGIVGAAAAAAASGAGEGVIVFFSWSGHTRALAQEIARQTGFQAVELQLETPYSSDYSTCLMQAQQDQNAQARPALSVTVTDLNRYGIVLLGFPNWWASIPMPIATFLESGDFAGKTIMPFASNGGGGLGQSVSAISKLAPGARVTDGLSVYEARGAANANEVAAWLSANGVSR